MRCQPVRVSQMVLTWGPGAILETRGGPRLILRADRSLRDTDLERLEITCPELSAVIAGKLGFSPQEVRVRIFHVPSNLELGRPPDQPVWETIPFPGWKLCTVHGVLYRRVCPVCGRGQHVEAIRFVLACPRGHLDDVDWHAVVHGRSSQCRPDYYRWEGGGGSLSDVRVTCPRCGRSVSLGGVYGRVWRCTGRFPEREQYGGDPYHEECPADARIVQRQASNVRVPEVLTLFTVPPPYTHLHQVLGSRSVLDALKPVVEGGLLDLQAPGWREQFVKVLDGLVRTGKLGVSGREEVLACPDEELQRVLRDVLEYHPPASLDDMLDREFRQFVRGAREGVPPRGTRPRSRILFEIDPAQVREVTGSRGPAFLVVPVLRLRAVTVQIGYRRMVESPSSERCPDLVDISHMDRHGNRWFPGYESSGEGLFIMLARDGGRHPQLQGRAASRWAGAFSCSERLYVSSLFRSANRRELHPVFVWWHTLSHLLMRALAVDSGYSLPSIRERIYLAVDDPHGVHGGVLLYTAARGGDASLGGLLALAPVFERILDRAFETLETCSADPLCLDREFHPGELMGAACHACCLLSETSCEHRNFWLDRHVLLENL